VSVFLFAATSPTACFTLSLHDALPIWCAFVQDLGRAVNERSVGDVRVAGDPANIGGAPVDVRFWFEVEHGLMRVGTLGEVATGGDRKSTRLNSSHVSISYAVFCLKKKT